MKNYILIIVLFSLSCFVYADNYLNPQTGEYYITTNDLLDNLTIQESTTKTNGEDAFDFMQTSTKNKLDTNKTLTLDTGTTNLAFERANETVVTSKFYTEEAKIMKKSGTISLSYMEVLCWEHLIIGLMVLMAILTLQIE